MAATFLKEMNAIFFEMKIKRMKKMQLKSASYSGNSLNGVRFSHSTSYIALRGLNAMALFHPVCVNVPPLPCRYCVWRLLPYFTLTLSEHLRISVGIQCYEQQ